MHARRERLLRTAFLAGALTDALAVVPMLAPSMAWHVWGFDESSGAYRFAMGYGATLMAAWTILLLCGRIGVRSSVRAPSTCLKA